MAAKAGTGLPSNHIHAKITQQNLLYIQGVFVITTTDYSGVIKINSTLI
jgi:hypothetical protein